MTTIQTSTGAAVGAPVQKAPTGVTATTHLTDTVTISWNAASGALSYTLYKSATADRADATLLASGLTDTSYDDAVTVETNTYYWVKAVNGAHVSAFSGMATARRELATPAVPGSVGATNLEVEQITVSWDEAARALGYNVYRAESNDSGAAVRIATTTELTYTDTTVTPGFASYFYWVKAWNYEGFSDFSIEHSGYAKPAIPAAPTGLSATIDEDWDDVDVSWDAMDGAATYNLYRDGEQIATGLTSPSYTDHGGEAGTMSSYQVSAVNETGESDLSDGVNGRRLQLEAPAPSATTNLASEIQVTWAAVDGATTYDILVDGAAFAFDVSSPYSITGLDPYTDYSIEVRARRDVGEGNASEWSFPAVTGRMLADGDICDGGGIDVWGGDDGYDNEFVFGGGALTIFFDAETIKDAMNVYVDGSLVWNTGCISGGASTGLSTSLGSHTLRIEVVPNCDRGSGTGWSFSVSCE